MGVLLSKDETVITPVVRDDNFKIKPLLLLKREALYQLNFASPVAEESAFEVLVDDVSEETPRPRRLRQVGKAPGEEELESWAQDSEFISNLACIKRSHPFEIFVTYRFFDSFRQAVANKNLWNEYRMQVKRMLVNQQSEYGGRLPDSAARASSMSARGRSSSRADTLYLNLGVSSDGLYKNLLKQSKKAPDSGKKLQPDVKFGKRGPGTPEAKTQGSAGEGGRSLFGAALSELNKARAAVAEKQVVGKKHLSVIQEQMKPLIERNIIAATWVDDMGWPQREMQDR